MVTYFDANATEPLRPAALKAMQSALEVTGNPSSVHRSGRAARALLEDSRERIAARLGGDPSRLVFTSGGTEANAAAVHALGNRQRILVAATEHDAVRHAAPAAATLSVERSGQVDPDRLRSMLRSESPTLVCVMLANNETGVLHPIAELAAVCHAYGAWLHVDAVQAAGRLEVDFAALDADSLAVSSHKVGGPTGGGAWLLAADRSPRPLIAGGGQERGWRGGTPPVAVLAGFAAALDAALDAPAPGLARLRDRLEAAALGWGAVAVGTGVPRLPNTCCLALPGVAAQTQVMTLDLAGFAVSAGAACSSGKVARSHVLDAMGLGDLAGQAIRVSLPWNADEAGVTALIDAYGAMAARLARRVA